MAATAPKQHLETEDLFREHAVFVARFLTRFGVEPAELDDAVQDVFLVVHRNGGYRPGPATPTTYLATIAVRAAASHRRRGRKRRERTADVSPDDVSSNVPDPGRCVEANEDLRHLQAALDQLDPDLKTTLILAELEGESCTAIAAAMQVPLGTVYWRRYRARKLFRDAVARRDSVGYGVHLEPAPARQVVGGLALASLRPAKLLRWARSQTPVSFDGAAALDRFQALLRAGASVPAWATATSSAGGAGTAVALAAPALLSAVVVAVAVHGGGRLATATTSDVQGPGLATPVAVAAAAPADRAAPEEDPLLAEQPPSSAAAPPSRGSPPADAPPAREPIDPPRPGLTPPAAAFAKIALPPATSGPAPEPLPAESRPALAAPPEPAAIPAPPPAPAADEHAAAEVQEIQEVAAAERLLATDPVRALALARAGGERFGNGYLEEERRYIAVRALFRLGRADEARPQVARFLTDYPRSAYAERLRADAQASSR